MRGFLSAIALLMALASGVVADAPDPFAFFAPSVPATDQDRDQLAKGGTIARIVPGAKRTLAVFSATPTTATADRLTAWMRDIPDLKKSKYVSAIGRFSDPPQVADVAGLTLEEGDIKEIARCRPGRCGLKLGADEIRDLQRAGSSGIQDAFRRIVVHRVERYLASGQGALPAYDDHGGAVSLQDHFVSLLEESPFLRTRLPEIATALERWPHAPAPQLESFLYWSKEQIGPKPVTSVTHVVIARHGDGTLPEVVVIARQLFATHYTDASISVTALVRDPASGRRCLMYLNRSDVDMLGGFWGGLLRRIAEHRLRSEAPAMLVTLRERLEGGDPPRLYPANR